MTNVVAHRRALIIDVPTLAHFKIVDTKLIASHKIIAARACVHREQLEIHWFHVKSSDVDQTAIVRQKRLVLIANALTSAIAFSADEMRSAIPTATQRDVNVTKVTSAIHQFNVHDLNVSQMTNVHGICRVSIKNAQIHAIARHLLSALSRITFHSARVHQDTTEVSYFVILQNINNKFNLFNSDPLVACNPIIIKEEGCRSDVDCPSKQGCFSGTCKLLCETTNPCGKNAFCTVEDTLPVRTMVCECNRGYIGNAEIECKLRKSQDNF
jgi:hypothetical protein